MKLTPDDFKTIQAYTGRKLKFIPNVKEKLKQSAYIARKALESVR